VLLARFPVACTTDRTGSASPTVVLHHTTGRAGTGSAGDRRPV